MTWRDKLEIGLKEDAPFRKDNLPESQVRGPETPTGPGRSPEVTLSRGDGVEPDPEDSGDEPAEAAEERPCADVPPGSRPDDRRKRP